MSFADRDMKDSVGVLLLNLGGPDSLHAVRPFLYNLFSDRDIIRLGPSFLQKPLAWFISTIHSKKSEKMYSLIGGKSPILDITQAQASALEKALNSEVMKIRSYEDKKFSSSHPPTNFLSSSYKVYVGMRYWRPFIKDTVLEVIDSGIVHLVVLSLFPHYSRATTGSAIAECKRVVEPLTTHSSRFMVSYIEQWYDFPQYIDSLAELVNEGLTDFDNNDINILFSAHSLPESFIRDGDPYVDHTRRTIQGVLQRLSKSPYNINSLRWHLAFQSRSGPVKWLQPATDETIIELVKSGVKNLLVVPISFVSDHIETLYEIDILYRELARKHGMNLKRCRSLNTSETFINALKELVLKQLANG
jgi:ferrochelatase